ADFGWSLDNEIRVIGVVPAGINIQTPAIKTAWGLASLRALAMMDSFIGKMEIGADRFSLGVSVTDDAERTIKPDWRNEYMEVIIVGYRDLSRVPAEMIMNDGWLF
ncbi:MAG: hypothetical protein V2A34_03955, partial [Lentisphaerota bacterium]